jgi:hypothetical protein
LRAFNTADTSSADRRNCGRRGRPGHHHEPGPVDVAERLQRQPVKPVVIALVVATSRAGRCRRPGHGRHHDVAFIVSLAVESGTDSMP